MRKEITESQRRFLEWVMKNKENLGDKNLWFMEHTLNRGYYLERTTLQEHLNKVRIKYLQEYKDRT